MPTNLQKRLERPTRTHLSIDQVQAVIASGSICVAFPFLGGTRISEQLGLCWDCEPDRQRGQRRCRIRRGNFSIAAERLRWFETDRSQGRRQVCRIAAQIEDVLAESGQRIDFNDRIAPFGRSKSRRRSRS